MKIGIGVTTTPARKLTGKQRAWAPPETLIATYSDDKQEGPARSRNRVLKALYEEGCDHIFTFDDDCYPVKPGWAEYIINHARRFDLDFVGLPSPFESELVAANGELAHWNSVLGCFTYQTRKCIETIGYYNTAYERYGHEDNGRSYRAVKAGLTGRHDAFASLLRVPFYVHSEDAYGECPAPNMSQEQKNYYIEKNRAEYIRETTSDKLYYPFS